MQDSLDFDGARSAWNIGVEAEQSFELCGLRVRRRD
jgi:hypothetical protein